MRVVLDTNVLLSALLSAHGLPDVIYRAWQKDRFELITPTVQTDNLPRASRYAKFKHVLQPHRVGTMVNNLRRAIVLDALPPLSQDMQVHDPNDVFLLAMALAGKADFLVTGEAITVPACCNKAASDARASLRRQPSAVKYFDQFARFEFFASAKNVVHAPCVITSAYLFSTQASEHISQDNHFLSKDEQRLKYLITSSELIVILTK